MIIIVRAALDTAQQFSALAEAAGQEQGGRVGPKGSELNGGACSY